MISWPAIIKFKGEDELLYILDENEWAIDPDLHCHPYDDGDTLIDSDGRMYSIPYNSKESRVEIQASEEIISIQDFESLILNHLVVLNQCCVSKMSILTFKQGMLLVEKTGE